MTNKMEKLKDLVSSWGLPGLILCAAINSFLGGDTVGAILLTLFALQLGFLIKLVQRLDPSVNKLLDWLILNIESSVLWLWWLIKTDFKRKYYKQLIYQCRDYRTQGLKTKGPFSLDLERVFVPLKVTPESLGHISSDMVRKKLAKNDLHI